MLAACARPDASVRSVALEHGLSPSIVYEWRRKTAATTQPAPGFISIPLSPDTFGIRIELQRSGTHVTVTWPMSAAAQCGAWLREVLQ